MKLIFVVLIVALKPFAWAGPILQLQSSGALNIYSYSLVGQTFTAEDSRIRTIGFYIEGYPIAPTTQVTYSLLTGAGTGGTLLDSASVTLPGTYNGWADLDFSSVNLTVGQMYTVLVTENLESLLVDFNDAYYADGTPLPGKIDYTGGEMIYQGQFLPSDDLTFRIEPIPEPGFAALFLLGGACLFGRPGRREPI